jgi:hypothetical protein
MEDRVGEVQQDQVSLGVLVTAVPRNAVDAAVAACGVAARRGGGKLPAHVTAYLTMALCLFSDRHGEQATPLKPPGFGARGAGPRDSPSKPVCTNLCSMQRAFDIPKTPAGAHRGSPPRGPICHEALRFRDAP